MDPGGSLQPAFEVSFNENLLAWTQAVMYWQLEEWADLAPVSFSWPYWVQLFLQSRKWNMGTSRIALTRGSFSFTFHKTSCFIFLCLYGSQCPEVAPFQLDLPEAKVAVAGVFSIDGLFGNWKTCDLQLCRSQQRCLPNPTQMEPLTLSWSQRLSSHVLSVIQWPRYNRCWSSVFSQITGQCGCHQS